MLAGKKETIALLPQKPPMVMVDGLLSHDAQKTVSTLLIEADNIFLKGQLFTEAGLVENIAQTAALRTGWMARQTEGTGKASAPPVGVIGGIKDLRIHELPPAGTRLTTTVSIVAEVMNATVVSGKVEAGGKTLAECEMKIFLQEQDA